MTPLAVFALAGCLAVNPGSDHVLVRDLVAALPALVEAAPDTPVALAPAPGVRRIFQLPELRRLAARLNVPAPESEICVERPAAILNPARMLEAMKKQLPQATIEILDFSRQPVPEGEFEFPLKALRQIPAGAFWSGYVQYAGTRRFPVWARVKVLVTVSHVIALASLQPGHPIDPAQLRLETREEFPVTAAFAASIDEAAGRIPRRSIAAGTALQVAWLDVAKEVVRGETVNVEVFNGGARLELEAQAEGSGSTGETIPVLNPVSKKRFMARVEGKGKVSVGKGEL